MEKLTLISPTAFGGLLASAIGKMDGMRGYLGIYISENLSFILVMLNTQRMAMDLYPRRHLDMRGSLLFLLSDPQLPRGRQMAS